MVHTCPYCGAQVSHGPEDTEVEDGRAISEVWYCPACKQTFVAEYEFSGYTESDGTPIPDQGEEP